jgi:hypothetical protein
MIDWHAKTVELKTMAEDLELWAGKTEGHLKLVLGRTADELKLLAAQIESLMDDQTNEPNLAPPPGWITDVEIPMTDEQDQ